MTERLKTPFIHEDFLLETEMARVLYHEYAKGLPIIDYHCHLPPGEVAENKTYENLAQIWLYGDHYKWRAMRSNGVAERFCTGDASDREKYDKWAETVPYTLRNPLYHWTHLELNRPFGINDRLLSPQTADSIWSDCAAMLSAPEFSARGIMEQMNVETVCTTDDPVDSLEFHKKIAEDNAAGKFTPRVLPTFRPDKAMAVDRPEVFFPWLEQLENVTGKSIRDFDALIEALRDRYVFFNACGCRLSDHGLGLFPLCELDLAGNLKPEFERCSANRILQKLFADRTIQLEPAEVNAFQWRVLFELGRLNHEFGWTQQFHFGAMRNNNTRKFKALGPDTGFDSIGDGDAALAMSRFLDALEREDKLTKTILYNLNPIYNHLVGTMLGNFQDGITAGKIQFGSGWWFLDQKDGMETQMNVLSALGLLRRFVGMLTDSRSFLSYTRHEYFRRILCNLLGNDVKKGILPNDVKLLGALVADVSYRNARGYFNF
ncbi:MAG: glucuronate isomerase [Planctomycetaceae bacterium]|nr:glucuronate isomerase [Planctomycetaceae bacterium]